MIESLGNHVAPTLRLKAWLNTNTTLIHVITFNISHFLNCYRCLCVNISVMSNVYVSVNLYQYAVDGLPAYFELGVLRLSVNYTIMTLIYLSFHCLIIDLILHFRSKYPFEDYISYANFTFTMKEIKHLWRLNGCESKYRRKLVMRTDDFEKPSQTNVLCSNWKEWEQPIIW
jgi:hypothetical protein